MLGKKGIAVTFVLMLGAVLLAGQARVVLDDIVSSFKDEFSEINYLPRGSALKVVACGFDAPFADALFIKAMLYFADTNPAKKDVAARRDFTYALFDVITDLSPRFTRAYQTGALFLTASALPNAINDGVRLLEKGCAVYERLAEERNPVVPDGRWLFHSMLANVYDVTIQTRRRRDNDLEGAAEARRRAGKEFRLAAASPGAPDYIVRAASGYESVLSGTGKIEDSQKAVLSVWQDLYERAKQRGDKDILPALEKEIDTLERRIAGIEDSREIEKILSQAGRQYLEAHGEPPKSVDDLLGAGLLPGQPKTPLGTDKRPDEWLAFPDGSFKSRTLAEMETANDLDLLMSAGIEYVRVHNKPPESLYDFVGGLVLREIPEPPLRQLGQAYAFFPPLHNYVSIWPEDVKIPPPETVEDDPASEDRPDASPESDKDNDTTDG